MHDRARRLRLTTAVAAVVLLALGAADAQAASVKETFEKYNLLGTFAWDCSKPASADNLYYLNRAIDEDHVQRDEMSGPTKRDSLAIIDKASALGPDEVSLGGQRNDQLEEAVWRVEKDRQQTREVSVGGKKVVSAGKSLGSGRDLRWTQKCSADDGSQAAPGTGDSGTAPQPAAAATPADGGAGATPQQSGEATPADGGAGATPQQTGEATPADGGTGATTPQTGAAPSPNGGGGPTQQSATTPPETGVDPSNQQANAPPPEVGVDSSQQTAGAPPPEVGVDSPEQQANAPPPEVGVDDPNKPQQQAGLPPSGGPGPIFVPPIVTFTPPPPQGMGPHDPHQGPHDPTGHTKQATPPTTPPMCHTQAGVTTCTDTQGHKCTSTTGSCDPATPQKANTPPQPLPVQPVAPSSKSAALDPPTLLPPPALPPPALLPPPTLLPPVALASPPAGEQMPKPPDDAGMPMPPPDEQNAAPRERGPHKKRARRHRGGGGSHVNWQAVGTSIGQAINSGRGGGGGGHHGGKGGGHHKNKHH